MSNESQSTLTRADVNAIVHTHQVYASALALIHAPVIAGHAGDRLTKGLKDIIERYKLPFVAYNQGSIENRFETGFAPQR